MDTYDYNEWVQDNFEIPPLIITHEHFTYALAGYLYSEHLSKKKWNEYQRQWRENNKDKAAEHNRKYAQKDGVKQKKREYAKQHYQKKKQGV